MTLNLPLRERVVPDWNKGRERGECKKKKKSGAGQERRKNRDSRGEHTVIMFNH